MLIDKTKACTQLNLMVPGPGSTGAVGRTSPEGCAAAVSATALLPSAGPVSARTGPPLPARSACLGQRSWSMACTICVPRSRLMVHVEVGLGLKSYHQTIFWCLRRAYKAPKAKGDYTGKSTLLITKRAPMSVSSIAIKPKVAEWVRARLATQWSTGTAPYCPALMMAP